MVPRMSPESPVLPPEDLPQTPAPVSPRALWGGYAAIVLVVGLLQGLAELQHYLERGGQHPWEPLLWELSSVVCMGALGVAVYRWHALAWQRLQAGGSRLALLGRHVLGALAYAVLHVSGMFALRFGFYALMGAGYEPGGPLKVMAYELGKDLVSYTVMVAVCHGLLLLFAEQQRQRELARLRAELAEAQLARLAEQIQPHFLFNTLNLISSVMYEDVPRADRILCDLATLLRQALAAEQAGRHALDEELALVQPYLSLMQARFGERLVVEIDVSPAARICQVPALLLISPVENAIKHDVAQSSGPVRVTVRGELRAGPRLWLQVQNSGVTPTRDEREGAIGLANTRARLQALYGDAASVTLAPAPGGGGQLTLVLPAQGAVAA